MALRVGGALFSEGFGEQECAPICDTANNTSRTKDKGASRFGDSGNKHCQSVALDKTRQILLFDLVHAATGPDLCLSVTERLIPILRREHTTPISSYSIALLSNHQIPSNPTTRCRARKTNTSSASVTEIIPRIRAWATLPSHRAPPLGRSISSPIHISYKYVGSDRSIGCSGGKNVTAAWTKATWMFSTTISPFQSSANIFLIARAEVICLDCKEYKSKIAKNQSSHTNIM